MQRLRRVAYDYCAPPRDALRDAHRETLRAACAYRYKAANALAKPFLQEIQKRGRRCANELLRFVTSRSPHEAVTLFERQQRNGALGCKSLIRNVPMRQLGVDTRGDCALPVVDRADFHV